MNGRRALLLLALVTFSGSLVLYARTAAPDVLSGDSAEFQFAAPLLAVPHPTGYPLYILLAKLATLVVPFGNIAHCVTLVSSLAGAGTVALLALLVWRATGTFVAALVAATALAVAPGLWNAATMAEVYTLHTFLLALLAGVLWQAYAAWKPTVGGPSASPLQWFWLSSAACVAGLGFSNHGSFLFTGVPLLVGYGAFLLIVLPAGTCAPFAQCWSRLGGVCFWGMVGLAPWLFVLTQYARMGPFNGLDHGLDYGRHLSGTPLPDPVAYFWGAPTTWPEAVAHLFGGVMRGGIFEPPGVARIGAVAHALGERLWFEFGPVGLLLGVGGFVALFRRLPGVWIGSVWVAGATVLYVSSLGRAVQDAMVFTLPLLLPWSLWVGVGATALAHPRSLVGRFAPHGWSRWSGWGQRFSAAVLVLFLVLMLAWGYTRFPYGNKSHLGLFRTFGEGALARMAPGAVVLTRWEQGTILQYLRLVEVQRPDIWVDIVEPGDEAWEQRIRRRYPDQTVYGIGSVEDCEALHARPVWGTDYATLFLLEPGGGGYYEE
ncbi:MAG: DUF2723 domain-containing protein [Chloroflexaceae bacterium]|nr:DUF2723 domain-containing protein [Chloroflexaceae bacterium]